MRIRRRINLSINEETYRKTQEMARRCGFRSASHLAKAALEIAVGPPPPPSSDREPPSPDIYAEIWETFLRHSDWQRENGNRHDINQRQ